MRTLREANQITDIEVGIQNILNTEMSESKGGLAPVLWADEVAPANEDWMNKSGSDLGASLSVTKSALRLLAQEMIAGNALQ